MISTILKTMIVMKVITGIRSRRRRESREVRRASQSEGGDATHGDPRRAQISEFKFLAADGKENLKW